MAKKVVAVKGNPFAKKAKGKMEEEEEKGKKGFVPFKKKGKKK